MRRAREGSLLWSLRARERDGFLGVMSEAAVITASKSNIDFYMQGNGYQFLEPGIEA